MNYGMKYSITEVVKSAFSIMLTILTHMFTAPASHLLGKQSTSALIPSSLQFTL